MKAADAVACYPRQSPSESAVTESDAPKLPENCLRRACFDLSTGETMG